MLSCSAVLYVCRWGRTARISVLYIHTTYVTYVICNIYVILRRYVIYMQVEQHCQGPAGSTCTVIVRRVDTIGVGQERIVAHLCRCSLGGGGEEAVATVPGDTGGLASPGAGGVASPTTYVGRGVPYYSP